MSDTDSIGEFHARAFSGVNLDASAQHVRSLIATSLDIPEDEVEHHPDVHWIAPEKLSISRAQMTEVLHELMLTSSRGTKRSVVIERAHTLTSEAANALLKTLEEPPEAVTFFLTTPSAARLLPTIRSRVIVQSVQSPEHELSSELSEEIESFIDGKVPDRFTIIARLQSEGRVRQFVQDITHTLRQRHDYDILEWMQLHQPSTSAPNYRLFLEALASSEVFA